MGHEANCGLPPGYPLSYGQHVRNPLSPPFNLATTTHQSEPPTLFGTGRWLQASCMEWNGDGLCGQPWTETPENKMRGNGDPTFAPPHWAKATMEKQCPLNSEGLFVSFPPPLSRH